MKLFSSQIEHHLSERRHIALQWEGWGSPGIKTVIQDFTRRRSTWDYQGIIPNHPRGSRSLGPGDQLHGSQAFQPSGRLGCGDTQSSAQGFRGQVFVLVHQGKHARIGVPHGCVDPLALEEMKVVLDLDLERHPADQFDLLHYLLLDLQEREEIIHLARGDARSGFLQGHGTGITRLPGNFYVNHPCMVEGVFSPAIPTIGYRFHVFTSCIVFLAFFSWTSIRHMVILLHEPFDFILNWSRAMRLSSKVSRTIQGKASLGCPACIRAIFRSKSSMRAINFSSGLFFILLGESVSSISISTGSSSLIQSNLGIFKYLRYFIHFFSLFRRQCFLEILEVRCEYFVETFSGIDCFLRFNI